MASEYGGYQCDGDAERELRATLPIHSVPLVSVSPSWCDVQPLHGLAHCCAQRGGFGDAVLGSFSSSSPRLWGSMAENLGAYIPLGAGWRGPEGWEALSWAVPALPPPAPAPQGLQRPLGKSCSIPGIPQQLTPAALFTQIRMQVGLAAGLAACRQLFKSCKRKKEGEGKPQSPPIKEAGWGRMLLLLQPAGPGLLCFGRVAFQLQEQPDAAQAVGPRVRRS